MTIFAIKKADKILVYTIAEWRRAVIVNYLIQEMGQKVFCTDTDEYVERLWTGYADGAEVVTVRIRETRSRPTPLVLPDGASIQTADEWIFEQNTNNETGQGGA